MRTLHPTAEPYLPQRHTLPSLREAVQQCEGCDLYRDATQAVFGEGKASARMMLVGETPGDREDVEGKPFVGPAGRLLDEALAEANIARDDVYVTNAVKHFRFEERGKRRLHKKPTVRQTEACKPWLQAELLAVKPKVLVCLGATAAQAILGKDFQSPASAANCSGSTSHGPSSPRGIRRPCSARLTKQRAATCTKIW